MGVKAIPSRRIKRGDELFTGRYWSAFMAGSFLAHIITLTVMSDAALTFIQGLKKTMPEYPLLYVALVYPPPAPLKDTAPMVKPVKSAPPRRARNARQLQARETTVTKPAAKQEVKPDLPDATESKKSEATLPRKEQPDVSETVPAESAKVIPEQETTTDKEADKDSIVVIRGAEKTVVVMAGTPPLQEQSIVQRPEPAPEKPPVLSAFSSVKAPYFHSAPVLEALTTIKPLDIHSIPAASVPTPYDNISSAIPAMKVAELQTPRVKITQPVEGDTRTGVVEVKGMAAGEGIGSVVLRVGKRVMELLLRESSFTATVPLEKGDNEITASVTDAEGREAHDRVTVNYTRTINDLNVSASFSGATGGIHLKFKWRQHPLAGTGAGLTSQPEFKVSEDKGGGRVSVGAAVPGIYTVGVEYDTGDMESSAVFEVSLYGDDPARKSARTFGPITLSGKGYLPVVRVMLPEGVFWEDDGWFTGTVQGSEGVLKFKQPEGIEWTETE